MALPNFNRYADKIKVPKGQVLKYKDKQGYYTAPKPQITVSVNKGGTSQNKSVIESPAQIEARVTRMAQSAYDRQKSDLDTEVARMRREAEGRRLGMIAAYKAAGDQSAGMASKVQAGWNTAADNLQGIAEATTGGIGDALRAETALQEDALSRVGAGGTGFDATSQQGVEAYRGGALPAEYFTREGGIANEYLQRMPDNLKRMGLQTADATERESVAKIAQDRLSQVRTLGENRVKYEETLREQLLGARADQLDASAAAAKLVADAKADLADLDFKYWNARQQATTKKELQAVDMVYKNEKLRRQDALDAALIGQRDASANLSNVRAENIVNNPTGAKKPPTPRTVAGNLKDAKNAANSVIDGVINNIWASAPGGPFPKDVDPKDKKYQAALAWNKAQKTKSFKTAYTRVVAEIAPFLKSINYTPLQVQQKAWDLLSARIPPPAGLKRPGKKGGVTAALPVGMNLNPGGRPSV